jgi:hypothetical protein
MIKDVVESKNIVYGWSSIFAKTSFKSLTKPKTPKGHNKEKGGKPHENGHLG